LSFVKCETASGSVSIDSKRNCGRQYQSFRLRACYDAILREAHRGIAPGIVKLWFKQSLKRYLAFGAFHEAMDLTELCQPAARRTIARHEVDQAGYTRVRLKGSLKYIRIGQIRLMRLKGPLRPYMKPAALLVIQNGGKDARRIEPGQATPVD
jgi:hypothetical protein